MGRQFPVTLQLPPWCVGPFVPPLSLRLLVCPDTSVGRLSVRSSSVVRGWKAPRAPRKFSRVPSHQAMKVAFRTAVACVAESRGLPATPWAGRPSHARHKLPALSVSGAGRAVGYLAAEFCPRPGKHPDDLIPRPPASQFLRKPRFAANVRPLLGTLLPRRPESALDNSFTNSWY